MVHAYVLAKTGTGESDAALNAIRELPRVVDAHIVAGAYDIIAEVEVDDVYAVLQTASSEMQSLDGVRETRTYIALD